ncbi:MAG: hypothetical protein Q8K93_02505 [Reyranella sp.]|uniref:hypothetical protein n=1 Tax=Reyranella sp. TaxID=1929291 RepID=UPI002731C820|nr:hypothetical protein [Reyranella sp.]MDP1961053.1 hypothetical protein [Reyranella sp.]MDP2378188.1 hypothetical protein [Reyranella sp.]
MTSVYILYHINEHCEPDEHHHGKRLGLFSTAEKAREAIRQIRDAEGFRDYPERWSIRRRTMDKTSWTDGFDIATHRKIEKKRNASEEAVRSSNDP